MYRNIVVPLDGSPFSEHALPAAFTLARKGDTTLHLVHVRIERASDITPQQEQTYLDGIAQRLSAAWKGQIVTKLLEGQIVPTLEQYATASSSDLVVMTTHGRGPISRAWLGSVADQLIRHLSIPILLIRPNEQISSDLANPPQLKHILIPLDGSQLSEQILPHALALSKLTGATITLLQTVELLVPSYGFEMYAPTDFDINTWMTDAKTYIDSVVKRLQQEGVPVKGEVLAGPAASTILEYAGDNKVDLIALETHGRSGAARVIMGSVADKVVRGATTPVLVHHPQATTGA